MVIPPFHLMEWFYSLLPAHLLSRLSLPALKKYGGVPFRPKSDNQQTGGVILDHGLNLPLSHAFVYQTLSEYTQHFGGQ